MRNFLSRLCLFGQCKLRVYAWGYGQAKNMDLNVHITALGS